MLVGGSSVGKTRACWEALDLLRDQDPPWRLWHPIDPSRPDAALRELPGIGPRTVVWLNEAQFYLDPLVLATVWPRFWDTLTGRPADGDDRHAQARELLAGHDITVPAAFTPAQMSQLAQAADVRMELAARSARDGEVIQFLAGGPELLARYRNAPPAAAALIDAAMDAHRLDMGAGLPQAFLEAAAPGYLTDAQWDALGEDWLEQALAYTAVPCKGARGPLTRIRPRPAQPAGRPRGDQPTGVAAAAGPLYRLADYLDQHGRAHRASQIPPAEFWSAAAAHAAPGDQAALGHAADARGLYRDAAQLYKNAAASGNLRAVLYLSPPPPAYARTPAPDAGPPPTPPSTTHTPCPACWIGCRLLARTSRPPRCWPVIRPPTPPSTTRPAWPSCWTACGRRARTSRPPRWPAVGPVHVHPEQLHLAPETGCRPGPCPPRTTASRPRDRARQRLNDQPQPAAWGSGGLGPLGKIAGSSEAGQGSASMALTTS